jgi:hypothetical protein
MPKPLKVKIFMNASASAVEDQLNTWLGQLGPAAIIKTDTTVTAVGERPCIVVTVWYEPSA